MDFKNLSKLSEKAYCDKLVVLTSDIIERYFNDMEITFLAHRIKNGVDVNDLKKAFSPGIFLFPCQSKFLSFSLRSW